METLLVYKPHIPKKNQNMSLPSMDIASWSPGKVNKYTPLKANQVLASHQVYTFSSFSILPRQIPFTNQQCCLVSFPAGTSGKESTCQWSRHRDMGSVPGLGRSPGRGNGNLLQCSWLVNSMDREELQTAEHTGTYNAQWRLLTQLTFYLHQNSREPESNPKSFFIKEKRIG